MLTDSIYFLLMYLYIYKRQLSPPIWKKNVLINFSYILNYWNKPFEDFEKMNLLNLKKSYYNFGKMEPRRESSRFAWSITTKSVSLRYPWSPLEFPWNFLGFLGDKKHASLTPPPFPKNCLDPHLNKIYRYICVASESYKTEWKV